MKRLVGNLFMCLGMILVATALGICIWNVQESRRAEAASLEIVDRLEDEIADGQPTDDSTEMTEKKIGDYYYIGYLTLPSLDIKLPVITDWNYDKLRVAACRYYGSTKTDDLVIAAHNYIKHFGQIKNLSIGDTVYFKDMDGEKIAYRVVEKDVLTPTSVKKMVSSEADLTLFTCTYGGESRVTIRCERKAKRTVPAADIQESRLAPSALDDS